VDDGIAVLGIDNAVQNKFAWAERRFIPPSKYEGLGRYKVFPRDVIITIMGTTGRSAVVPEDIPEAITTKHLATITCNKELIHPEVLSFAIHSDPLIIRQIKSFNKGAIMDGLNLGTIRRLEISLPPMDEQLRFVAMLRKARAIYAASETPDGSGEDLFQSLSQRAFRSAPSVASFEVSRCA
jgi:type I restriction enzyme S subunit